MRVLVVTVVHVPLDARIHARQISALRAAGHDVVYGAPWGGYGLHPTDHAEPRTDDRGALAVRNLPRAQGRDRIGALRAARRLLASEGARADIVLLHDPELLLAVPARLRTPVVWDVHEDTAGALVDKPWLPGWLRPVLRRVIIGAEHVAERRHHLLLAEERYADRFAADHPVVPNTPTVPDEVPTVPLDDPPRIVYLGRVSRLRGAAELCRLAERLAPDVHTEVIGSVDDDVAPLLRRAAASGALTVRGFVPNDEALAQLPGAIAGLSLLHDVPNYRSSLPTKLLEYLGRGVSVITTPLPAAARLVEQSHGGVVVPFGDVEAAAQTVRALVADPELARARGRAGHAYVRDHRSWNADAPVFVETIEHWAHP